MRRWEIRSRYIILLVLLLFIPIVYLSIYVPVLHSLQQETLDNFLLVAEAKQQMVEEFIARSKEGAEGLSSRSVIRDKIVDYREGNIGFLALKMFTEPKYLDGVRALERMVYVARWVDDQMLVDFGEEVDCHIEQGDTDTTQLRYDEKNGLLCIQSPILKNNEVLGQDYLYVALETLLLEVVDAPYQIRMVSGLDSKEGLVMDDDVVEVHQELSLLDNQVVISVPRDVLFADVNRLVNQTILSFFLGFLILFILINQILMIFTKKTLAEMDMERKKAQRSEQERDQLINQMHQGLAVHEIICDESGMPVDYRFLDGNESFFKEVGLKKEDVVGKTALEIFPNTETYWIEAFGKVAMGEGPVQVENYAAALDKYFHISVYSPQPGCFATISTDMTERKKMQRQMAKEKEQFQTTLLTVAEGIASTDAEGKVVVINPVALNLLGRKESDVQGQMFDEIFVLFDEKTNTVRDHLIAEVLQSNESLKLTNHYRLKARQGEIPIEMHATPIRDDEGQAVGVVVVFWDYSEQKERHEQIEYLSFHDHLTGLYNRRYIENAMKRLDNTDYLPLTIMLLDVNGLKLTNDAYGHQMGDALLIEVTKLLKDEAHPDAVIGRVGGDEFMIVLPHTHSHEASVLKGRLLYRAKKSQLDSVIVSLAVGYATKETNDVVLSEIVLQADQEMYKNKVRFGQTMRHQTIEKIRSNINFKYDQEQIHAERVSFYGEAMANALHLSPKEIHDVKIAGLLHDIGKIMVPPEILSKFEPLTAAEFDIIRRHPEVSYQILKGIDEYAMLAEGVLHHHECYDGQGYPEGLRGEKIPLLSRIIAVADAYEAMTGKRPYQKKLSKTEAIEELRRHAGTKFDPRIVAVFINEILTKEL